MLRLGPRDLEEIRTTKKPGDLQVKIKIWQPNGEGLLWLKITQLLGIHHERLLPPPLVIVRVNLDGGLRVTPGIIRPIPLVDMHDSLFFTDLGNSSRHQEKNHAEVSNEDSSGLPSLPSPYQATQSHVHDQHRADPEGSRDRERDDFPM